MLLGGLWHGAGLQFVVWGALHGFYLTINHLWVRHAGIKLPAIVSLAITFGCVIFAWIFFRAADFAQAAAIINAMAALTSPALLALEIYAQVDALIAM